MNSKMKYKPITLIKQLRRSICKLLKKHHSNDVSYKDKILKEILFNEKSHLVANFKDFLIFDDSTEFLKR